MSAIEVLLPGGTSQMIQTAPDVAIHVRFFAAPHAHATPLLVLHGHPQTMVIWHKVLPELRRHFRVVLADLRGYGDSSKPEGGEGHVRYSKREMAADMLAVMQALGHTTFGVLAHDRGARVAHRLAADYPHAVQRLMLLDIAPTLAMYEQTDEAFARAYWHWFFLIQRAPMPEQFIERDVRQYLGWVMRWQAPGQQSPFVPLAIDEYARCLSQPGAAHALCEDYRAAATIDLEHDRADRAAGKRLPMPLQVLWGARGIIERCFEPLVLWREVAEQVTGHTLPCGHYLPEEAPELVAAEAVAFFGTGAMR